MKEGGLAEAIQKGVSKGAGARRVDGKLDLCAELEWLWRSSTQTGLKGAGAAGEKDPSRLLKEGCY